MIEGVRKVRLENGLNVLIKRDPKVPVACVLTWVKCGYFDERDNQAGISHLIEHLFFKGTPSRGVGEIAKETKRIGGYLNAATIYDHTNYYVMVPSKNVLQAIEIQADALLNPLFDAEEMEKEKKVIIQEMKRKLDTPHSFSREKLFELSFQKHPIGRWRIGTPEGLLGFSRENVQEFYEQHYVPENTCIVIAGDVKPDEVEAAVRKQYGGMSGTPRAKVELPQEPLQMGARMKRLNGDISRSFVKMGFVGPKVFDEDYFAVSALSVLLGKGRSSRLYRSLREDKALVHGIASTQLSYADMGYIMFEAETDVEKMASVEEELWVQISKIKKDPPSTEEINKVRNVVESNFFREKEDVMGQAYSLAYFESLGGFEKSIDYINGMRSVTSKSMLEAAEKYFQFSKMNLLEYVPRSLGLGAESENRLESLEKRISQKIDSSETPQSEVALDNPPSAPFVVGAVYQEKMSHQSNEFSLPSGARLVHLQNSSLPLVSVNVRFLGGRLDETEANAGLTHFTLRNSLKGTEKYSAEELAFKMESLGMALGVEASADHFGYSMNVLKSHLEPALDLLSQVVLQAQFPAHEMEKERRAMLANIRKVEDDMFRYPIELFYRALYGMHPYGLPRHGSFDSISSIHRDDVQSWHEELFSWDKMTISVVGDIEMNEALDKVLEHFSLIDESNVRSRAQIFPVVPSRNRIESIVEKPRHQTGFALGFSGVDIKNPQYYSLEVLRNMLAGMGGRLFQELREARSLAYSVTAFNIALLRGGAFFAYAATNPNQEEEVKNRILNEFERIKTGHMDEQGFIMAKNFSKGSHAISMQSNSAMAYMLAHQKLLNISPDAFFSYDRLIDEVTMGSVFNVAESVFDPQKSAIGMVRGISKGTKK